MQPRNLIALSILHVLALSLATVTAAAADWPMWRGDAGRSGATTASLPDTLRLQWTLQLPRLKPAWQEDSRLQFDAAYQPIVVGKRLIVASSRNDSVSSYDTDSGKRQWRFFTDGPVRFAPLSHDGKLYFGADDGCVYCLDVSSGKQLWKFRAAPGDRRVLGNERLISVWPVRSGLVMHEGRLFFTAGVWPFEGTFLYTLDAGRGTLLKMDNLVAAVTTPMGSPTTLQDRCPQGYLAISGDRLFVPCGRANACCFSLSTGKPVLLQYNGSKLADYQVAASGSWLVQGDTIVNVDARQVLGLNAFHPVITGGQIYFSHLGEVMGLDLENQREVEVDQKGKKIKTRVPNLLCRFRDEPVAQIDLKTGNRLYGHAANVVYALDVLRPGEKGQVSWRAAFEGEPASMLAGDDKLFVVTREGEISCFGTGEALPVRHEEPSVVELTVNTQSPTAERVSTILKRAPARDGYGLVLGIESIDFIEHLVRQSQLQLIVIDANADKVADLRRLLDAAGLYGTRVAAVHADPLTTSLPPYMAQLAVADELAALTVDSSTIAVETVFQSLRPYGGVAFPQYVLGAWW